MLRRTLVLSCCSKICVLHRIELLKECVSNLGGDFRDKNSGVAVAWGNF